MHIDIVGAIPTKSVGGREYAYTVVDDYTRAAYTRPPRPKSEAADAYKSLRVAAENKSGFRLRAVVIDNARELSMGEVRDICKQDGIKLYTLRRMRWLSAPSEYSPMRRALYDSGLPDYLWAEAFNTATYAHNRTPTRALDGRTPFEVRYGAKPDLAHLRGFGAPCIVVQPLEKLRKP